MDAKQASDTEPNALDKDTGALYTWGTAQGGRLGHSHDEAAGKRSPKFIRDPVQVTALSSKHIVQVACGAFHMLASDLNGHAWSWGT